MRFSKTHRTLDDIATACNVPRKEVSKKFRVLHTRLDLKIPQQDPMKCIAKVANIAKLSEKTKRQTAEIMSNVMKEQISAGKDPMGLAISVLYLSSIKTGESVTQMSIASATTLGFYNEFLDATREEEHGLQKVIEAYDKRVGH